MLKWLRQGYFNKLNLYFKSHPEVYEQYLTRQIANMYLRPPHGQGMSANKIVELLHVSHSRIKEAIIEVAGKKYYRNQKKSCRTPEWSDEKSNAWDRPDSGYNTSKKMLYKNKKIKE
jgi:hypothetical protein